MRITIEQRIAKASGSPLIVCCNSGDSVTFSFDAEWAEYTEKTAHFRYIRDGTPVQEDVRFSGVSCEIPVLHRTDFVEIGVSAGSIRTSTPARIPCAYSIADIPAKRYAAGPDLYNQLADMLQAQMHPLPALPPGCVYIVTADGAYVTAADGSYIIAKE